MCITGILNAQRRAGRDCVNEGELCRPPLPEQGDVSLHGQGLTRFLRNPSDIVQDSARSWLRSSKQNRNVLRNTHG